MGSLTGGENSTSAGNHHFRKYKICCAQSPRRQAFINNYGAGDGIALPFDGVRGSGHGWEKGLEALYGFSTLKTIAIKHGI